MSDRLFDLCAGESTDDADLVAWVTIGLQHLPRSEDVPVVCIPRAALRLFRCDNGCASRRCLLASTKWSLISSRKASVGMRPHGSCQNLLQRMHLLVHTFSG